MKQPKKEKFLNSKFAIATISSANCYQEAPSLSPYLSLSLSLYPRVAQASEQGRTLKQARWLSLASLHPKQSGNKSSSGDLTRTYYLHTHLPP
jgi:hypothetical protein